MGFSEATLVALSSGIFAAGAGETVVLSAAALSATIVVPGARLSDRLRKLVRKGVLRRVAYEKRPPRFEYRLTEKGIDLYPLIVAMIGWGDRWMAGSHGVPVELVHRPCGHSIKPQLICPTCKSKIEVRDMSARPGSALKGRRLPGQQSSEAGTTFHEEEERRDDSKAQL